MIHTVGLDPDQAARLELESTPLSLPLPDGALPAGEEGWIIVAEDAPPETLGSLVRAVICHPMRWCLFIALNGAERNSRNGTLRLVALSVGNPVPAEFVAERLRSAPGVFSLRHATHEIARIRHDLNNPLTAAMAETQLMRMDSDDQGLEVVETQLRRMRDLIAELAQWRLPR
jgi:signal transduction histidine kinase